MIITDIPRALEVFPFVLEIEKETLLLVIVYCIPGRLGPFIDDFILLINEMPTQLRILIVGDFNLGQMSPENSSFNNLAFNPHYITYKCLC